MVDLIELTRSLVNIPSVTGDEGPVGRFLLETLRNQGWNCRSQTVSADRINVLAVREEPRILLTTHMDTVPPFFEFRQDEEFMYGRGVSDAKGLIAAMICAADGLLREGISDVGLLFVVGEETESDGAWKARELGLRCDYIIDGEPTDNELVVGHKGMVYAVLGCDGVTAHSAYPEQGVSAIDKLVSLLAGLQTLEFPSDATLGETTVNVGLIRGGHAPNVIPDLAEAEILFRTVAESAAYVDILTKWAAGRANLEIRATSEPQEMASVPGLPTKVVGYGTDVPALRALGRPLLVGPGSILVAHTAEERVSKSELQAGVRLYQDLVRRLRDEVRGP